MKCRLGVLQWADPYGNNKSERQTVNHLDALSEQSKLVTKYEVSLKTNSEGIDLNCKNIMDIAFEQRIDTEICEEKFIHSVDFIRF